jgi:hypothetical protein
MKLSNVYPPKASRRRQIERTPSGVFARVEVVEFEATDTPYVYTAHLVCGHSARFDMRGRGATKTIRCPRCTDGVSK